MSYYSLISLMPKSSGALLLDLYPNAAVAYSLRKLRTAYTGAAIRVRRTDLTEQDIAFDSNGDLDTTALLSFVGTGVLNNGFVTTWYDQSGNNKNATNATAINQPRIVNGGVVDVENGKPAMIFDGSNDQLESGAFTLNQPTTQFGVGKINSGYNTSLNYTFASSTNASNRQHFFYRSTGKLAFFAGTTLENLSNSTSVQFLFSAIFNSTNSELYFNNSLIVSGNAGSQNFGGNLLIGNQSTTSRWFGTQQEFIFYGVNQSINRVGIETNINTHYNIYP